MGIKKFAHIIDSEEIKLTTEILYYSGTNSEERKKVKTKQEAWRTVNVMFEEKEKMFLKELAEKDKTIDEQDKLI
ncbi:MAG: hypothetical protein WCK02_11175 [Bacteroidota bacterium]